MTTPPALHWRKSSYSGGSGTECVECARTCDGTLVRDSKCAAGPVVVVRSLAWERFIQALQGRLI